jgi:hypothetical protein
MAALGTLDPDRLRCGRCGDDLLPEEVEGHLNSEGRSSVSEMDRAGNARWFRAWKTATRIRHFTAAGDRERAVEEFEALMGLVEEESPSASEDRTGQPRPARTA